MYRVDESHLTGESDDVSKDPFQSQALYSGSKVVSGFGKMIITAVGTRSQSGAVAEMIAAAGEGRFASAMSSNSSTSNTASSTTRDTRIIEDGTSSEKDKGESLQTAAKPLAMPVDGLGRLREETVLQRKLAGYAATIGQLGLGAAIVASASLMGRFTYDTFFIQQLPWDWEYLHSYLSFFITGVTILVG